MYLFSLCYEYSTKILIRYIINHYLKMIQCCYTLNNNSVNIEQKIKPIVTKNIEKILQQHTHNNIQYFKFSKFNNSFQDILNINHFNNTKLSLPISQHTSHYDNQSIQLTNIQPNHHNNSKFLHKFKSLQIQKDKNILSFTPQGKRKSNKNLIAKNLKQIKLQEKKLIDLKNLLLLSNTKNSLIVSQKQDNLLSNQKWKTSEIKNLKNEISLQISTQFGDKIKIKQGKNNSYDKKISHLISAESIEIKPFTPKIRNRNEIQKHLKDNIFVPRKLKIYEKECKSSRGYDRKKLKIISNNSEVGQKKSKQNFLFERWHNLQFEEEFYNSYL